MFRYLRPRKLLRSYIRNRGEARLVARSGLFDAKFYLEANRDVARSGHPPLLHYLVHGWSEGRRPHPLFDGDWYLRENPDVAQAGVNPLVHFLQYGAAAARNPNPFFDMPWYVRTNPDVIPSGLNPIVHFLTIGSARLADPSPAFSMRSYLDQNPDVAAAGTNPLVHFLLSGREEGRLPKQPEPTRATSRPVAAARIQRLAFAPCHAELALLATYSRNGLLRPHVRGYLEALRREGIGVILIVATDSKFTDDGPWLRALVDGLFVRSDEGFDFAAWAHVLLLHPELFDAKILYWVNDSVLGPVNDAAFHKVIERIRISPLDLLGLTENFEPRWHIQSYFLALTRGALESRVLRQFVQDIVSFANKSDVIKRYEVELAPALAVTGLTAAPLFKAKCAHNPLAFRWRELLAEGFPFIKINTVRDDIPGVDKTGWRDALEARGFDVGIADQTLAEDIALVREASGHLLHAPRAKKINRASKLRGGLASLPAEDGAP